MILAKDLESIFFRLLYLYGQLFLHSAVKYRKSLSRFFSLDQLFLCPQSYLTKTQLSKL